MSDRPYRILHTEASIGWGGQEIRVLTEAAKFAAEGHQVHLVCDPDSDIFAAAPDYGIERTALPMKRKSLAGLSGMRGLIRDWRPDVVNPHSSIDHWLAALARMGLSRRPAIVRTRHISAPVGRNPASRWLYNRGAEGLMATSHSIVQALTGDGFLPKDSAAAVPTGIDTDRFTGGSQAEARAVAGLSADAFIFAIVATLRSWKGHSYLLDALGRLADPTAQLVIVGDGPQEENLRKQIAELGLSERVHMAGRQKDVLPYLRAADAFVLPSYANEGVPQACRLPIVTCPTGGIPELTAGLQGVRFAKAKDAESLAAAMAGMMSAPAEDPSRGALRARVVENFSRDVMYRNALAAFDRAIRLVTPSRD